MSDYRFLDKSISQSIDSSLYNLKGGKSAALEGEAKNARTPEEIKKTAQYFEAVFLSQMTKFMYEDVEVDPLWGGGHAEETFRVFLFDEYGKSMAKAGGIGVADMVQQQLLQQQGLEVAE